jgi:ATP-dependent Clp protease ATP-binding subunit ClpA
MTILGDLAIPIEVKNKTTITYFALREAIQLSARYLTNKAYPAKAIDLLQDSLNYPENGIITAGSVQSALERTTGAKVGQAQAVEKGKLLQLEDLIHQRMINQTQAVSAVSQALRRSRAGVRDPKRPAGSFLLLGPTGVGKTELARSLAAVYYGGEDHMIRLDMSEYQQVADITRLLEAPSENGAGSAFLRQLTQRPFSVVLLDEIEKAHPDILNLLLQMLDEGKLTDTAGKAVSFKEAIIIVTSNAGADEIRQQISAGADLAAFKDELVNSIIAKGTFKPELINRFDEVVLFRPLTAEELAQVVKIMLVGLNKTLAAQNISVTLTDAAIGFIVQHGYDAQLGARPMRRALQQYVENTISRKILADELQAGTAITLDVADLEAAAPSA